MKKTIFLTFSLLMATLAVHGQAKYKRPQLNYKTAKINQKGECSEEVKQLVGEVFELIDQNDLERATTVLEDARNNHGQCVHTEYLFAEFRYAAGEWVESWELIDAALKKYGPYPELIYTRSRICVEMAEYGTHSRAVNGMMAYLPDSKALPYNEEQFKATNLEYASKDLEFLTTHFDQFEDEILKLGMIYTKMGQYEKSNATLLRLGGNEKWRDQVAFIMSDNDIALNDFVAAEQRLKNLESVYPRNPKVLRKLANLYAKMRDKPKEIAYEEKADFYEVLPKCADLPFSSQNIRLLRSFGLGYSMEGKNAALDTISQMPIQAAIDFYISILNLHENHGNGIEERVSLLLGKAGTEAVEKLIAFMPTASTICGMGNAGWALAITKDQRAWVALLDMLEQLRGKGYGMHFPKIPSCIVKFDSLQGMDVLLPIIKEKLEFKEDPSKNGSMESLEKLFEAEQFYFALKLIDQQVLRNRALQLGYTEEQAKQLLERVYFKPDDKADK
jgi:tetratricopeptide (TPR) repeat protein